MNCPRRNPTGVLVQINPSANMAWAASRSSSWCGDGTGLGSGTALARDQEESVPHEEYEEHGRISIHGRADGSAESREGVSIPGGE